MREALAADEDRRAGALVALAQMAPEDGLLALAYWTAVRDHANKMTFLAASEARREGQSWAMVGLAYGDKGSQTAYERFAK